MSGADAEKGAPKEDVDALRSVLAAGTLTGEKVSVLGLLVRAVSESDSLGRFLDDILIDVERSASALGCDLSDDGRVADGEKLFRIHRKVEAVRHILDRAFDAGILLEVTK